MELQGRLTALERELLAWFRQNEVARRLETIPGIGVVVATAFAATVTDPQRFRSGRQFAAWLGLTPLANSSGGKERMGRISKMGDPYLRRLMVVGATSRVRVARRAPERERPLADLLQRKPARAGNGRSRQPNGADRLGVDGAGRCLPVARIGDERFGLGFQEISRLQGR